MQRNPDNTINPSDLAFMTNAQRFTVYLSGERFRVWAETLQDALDCAADYAEDNGIDVFTEPDIYEAAEDAGRTRAWMDDADNHGTIEYLRIIDGLVARGAQGIVLGCTEIELLIEQHHVARPLFPTTRLHAEAAVEWALAP